MMSKSDIGLCVMLNLWLENNEINSSSLTSSNNTLASVIDRLIGNPSFTISGSWICLNVAVQNWQHVPPAPLRILAISPSN